MQRTCWLTKLTLVFQVASAAAGEPRIWYRADKDAPLSVALSTLNLCPLYGSGRMVERVARANPESLWPDGRIRHVGAQIFLEDDPRVHVESPHYTLRDSGEVEFHSWTPKRCLNGDESVVKRVPANAESPVVAASPDPVPSVVPSAAPSPIPSAVPSSVPSPVPSLAPSPDPVPATLLAPKPSPTPSPMAAPTPVVVASPDPVPLVAPSPTPSPAPTPVAQSCPVPIDPTPLATSTPAAVAEDDGPEPESWLSVGGRAGFFRLRGRDPLTGGTATVLSDINTTVDLAWQMRWSEIWSSTVGFGLTQVKIQPPLGRTVDTLKTDLFAFQFGVAARATSRVSWHLNLEMEQMLSYRAITTTAITLPKVSRSKAGTGFELFLMRRRGLELSIPFLLYYHFGSEVSGAVYNSGFNEARTGLMLSHEKNGKRIQGGIYIRSSKAVSDIVEDNQTDIGFSLGYSWRLWD